MRSAFFATLIECARSDENLYLLTADLGFRLFDAFRQEHPDRFINVGVAESNMIGLAAGMSLAGKNVYCYSLASFLVFRAYEQVRIDVAYHNCSVKLVGAGGGVHYGTEGFTHFAVEDLALMRALPNMSIVVPADRAEARCVAQKSCGYDGPLYIRLAGNGGPDVHMVQPDFEIGRAMVLHRGHEVALFATGSMVHVAEEARLFLGSRQVRATIVDMHTINPLDVPTILEIASSHKAIFSIEEHRVAGGLGSAIAEVLSEHGYAGIFKRFGIPDRMPRCIGAGDYLKERMGLTGRAIAEDILECTGRRKYGIVG